MARNLVPVEESTFIQGLITEVNVLAFPPNASVDERNFEVRRNGTRRRRFGCEAESSYQVVDSGFNPTANNLAVFSGFTWDNAGGDPSKKLGVVQVGSVIKIFDIMTVPISQNEIFSYDTAMPGDSFFSFAVVDGLLVVATGAKEFIVFSYSPVGGVSVKTDYIRVRDLFGVEDVFGGADLTQGSGVTIRPTALTEEHRYNLRNQSFAIPRPSKGSVARQDPIVYFRNASGSTFPSNADAVFFNYYPEVSAPNATVDRFHAEDLVANPPGSTPAGRGFFIIDALERGASRLQEYSALLSREPALAYPLTNLPEDRTPNGASVVCEFAGRIWFSGFSGEVVEPDQRSPYLSSYVFFSRLVSDFSDVGKCYQEGDPTSQDAPDIVATDGGFIRIAGAYGIVGLKTLTDGVLIIATNGVWRISGGDTGFDATDYMVEKITDHGCTAPNTILEVDGSVFFWGDDGIYIVAQNELGDFKAQNLTHQTIQSFYEDIPALEKKYCSGIYDAFDRKVRWIYGNTLTSDYSKELVFDVNLGAFFPNVLGTIQNNRPKIVTAIKVPPFRLGTVVDTVVSEGTLVESETTPVVISSGSLEEGLREIAYVVLLQDSVGGSLQYTFGFFNNDEFTDWEFFNNVGLDAEAFMLTGYLTGQDTQRDKGVVSLTVHMERTEDGFVEDGNGNLTPTNQSSCLIQAQWEWTNSANAGRWGPQFQAYRYRRVYLPTDVSDPFDTGYSLVSTTSRIRGKGKALSFLIKTEPKKDCRVLGWAMIVGGK